MSSPTTERASDRIRLDHATLRAELHDRETRYTIALSGHPEDRWIEAYRSLQQESAAHRRFQLEPAASRIAFSCPTVEGPALVLELLERLEALLELTDRRLAAERWQAAGAARLAGRTTLAP